VQSGNGSAQITTVFDPTGIESRRGRGLEQ